MISALPQGILISRFSVGIQRCTDFYRRHLWYETRNVTSSTCESPRNHIIWLQGSQNRNWKWGLSFLSKHSKAELLQWVGKAGEKRCWLNGFLSILQAWFPVPSQSISGAIVALQPCPWMHYCGGGKKHINSAPPGFLVIIQFIGCVQCGKD